MTKQFKTNLRCQACIATIKPLFDGDSTIKHWSADTSHADKVLTVEGNAVDSRHVAQLLEKAGYQSLGEVTAPSPPAVAEPPVSYFPLLLILAYLVGIVGLIEWTLGGFDLSRAMMHFMAGFFLVFSFFKLLTLTAFADSYAMYDIVARRSRAYALAYPFIELSLGLAYLAHANSVVTNLVTLVVMGVSAVGVVQSLFSKQRIRCACLGGVFNLPMSFVTLVEDGLMIAMAAWMLFG